MSALQQILSAAGAAAPPPAGISFVAAGALSRLASGGSTTHIAAAPAGIQDGDLLFAFLLNNGSTNTLTAVPSGFTLVTSHSSGGCFAAIYKKTASSESGNYSFTWANNSNNGIAVVFAYRGADTLNTIGTWFFQLAGQPIEALTISPTVAGALLAFYCSEGDGITSDPSGMTRRMGDATFTGNTVGNLAVCELNPSGTGATGGKILTFNNSAPNKGILIQITDE